jgi:hypothetical protein
MKNGQTSMTRRVIAVGAITGMISLVASETGWAAPEPGTRFPFQQQVIATNCSTSTILCEVDFPPIRRKRRVEIKYASCYFQAADTTELNFLTLFVEQTQVFVSLTPNVIDNVGIKQVQSSDQILLYLDPEQVLSARVGAVTSAGGQWVSGLACMISGEEVVTR